jgi:hypothetical protein
MSGSRDKLPAELPKCLNQTRIDGRAQCASTVAGCATSNLMFFDCCILFAAYCRFHSLTGSRARRSDSVV